ncbi:MAG: SGNH/GDSL hydrolase family protein [Curtobacterium sp.]
MPRRTDDGGRTVLGRVPTRTRRPTTSAVALGLMALGVGAFVVLLPSVSDACQPATTPVSAHAEAALDPGSRVLIVGDSYTTGRGSSDGNHGWAQMISENESWRSTIDGIPGSGYVNRAATDSVQNTYLPRIESHADLDPDLVLVQGSQNDWTVSTRELRKVVTATLRQAEEQWPDALVVAIGPSAPAPLATATTNISDAVGAGARAAGVPYVDAVDAQWFTEFNSRSYAAADGEHLDDAGYRYLARRIAASLHDLTETTAECQPS